jgi:hypothetical protein
VLVREGAPARAHSHGLGINPADGRLFIATHNGLFAAAEGETTPKQVGTSTQDVMGFSVVGPDRFVGSGHPSLDQDAPPNLGLIESRDGDKSWKTISLLGEADLHVLQAAGGRVWTMLKPSVVRKKPISANGNQPRSFNTTAHWYM